jgi:hypothetical protein
VALVLAAGLGWAQSARAQACCAGAGVLSPTRLKFGEDAMLATQSHALMATGSLDATGAYLPNPTSTSEVDLEQDLILTLRVVPDGQLTVVAPLQLTRRVVPGLAEAGGGLGDLAVSFRYEFVPPNTSETLPGIALLAGASLPTGLAPEEAHSPLATDATGLGSAQLSVGVDVEREIRRIILDGTLLATQRLPRTVGGVHEQLGPQGTLSLAVGYAIYRQMAVAVSGVSSYEGQATINGQAVPQSQRWLTSLGLSFGLPLSEAWRVQGRLFENLPTLGANQTAGPGITATLMRTF